MLYKTNLNLY